MNLLESLKRRTYADARKPEEYALKRVTQKMAG
jgi:hypothetical protein